MIHFRHKGRFARTDNFFVKSVKLDTMSILHRYGQIGVNHLAAHTPKDTGLTAASWGYKIKRSGNSTTIYWTNSHVVSGVSIAIILQYGHGTRNGGYVVGRDYINPAIRPAFEQLAEDVWREVTNIE